MRPDALAFLAELLDGAGVSKEVGVRVELQGEGWSVVTQAPADDDAVLRHAGRVVLAISALAQRALIDRRLDVAHTNDGPVLTIV